jgi:single-stranded-DNA-specific exonuclease
MSQTAATAALSWKIRESDPEEVRLLSERLSVHPITAQLLIQRGIRPSSACAFLAPSTDLLYDPFLFQEMNRATARILRAIERNEKILIYGDYDVDGITGTALLVETFRQLGHPVIYYIPDRFKEGYGLQLPSLRRAREDGTTLVIAVDCGTTAHDEIKEAVSFGVDIVVVDHHQLASGPPPAAAFLNPGAPQGKGGYPFQGLSSVGVAFKLAEALFQRCGLSSLRLRPLLDLVALGTMADVAPLIEENRFFVSEGLRVIREGARPGIAALLHLAEEETTSVTERTLAYRLAPQLNAAGRLYHAGEAVALLTAPSWEEALPLAERLAQYNRERRQIEMKMWEEAERQVEAIEGKDRLPLFVLASEGWHPGVVGIIASRLAERYRRPAIIIALSPEGIGRGSGRSVEGIDLHRLVSTCRPLLDQFGGHAQAIGLTIQADRIDLFREAVVNLFSEISSAGTEEVLWIDAEINLEEMTFDWVRAIETLAPFGPDHPEPVFLARNLFLVSVRREPDRPVRFKVRDTKRWTVDVVAPHRLKVCWDAFEEGAAVDLAFTPEVGNWQGESRVFLRFKGIRRAGLTEGRPEDRC